MTLFRLNLPVGDYEGRILADCDTVRLAVPGVGWIQVPVDAVAEVPPSLPEEPPIGSVVLDNGGDAWQRCVDRWEMVGAADDYSWAEINERFGPLRRLRPDPSDDAPELPREELIANVAQAMRDANTPDAWVNGPQIMPMDHFAQVAVDHILVAREARRIQHNTQEEAGADG